MPILSVIFKRLFAQSKKSQIFNFILFNIDVVHGDIKTERILKKICRYRVVDFLRKNKGLPDSADA